VRLGGKFPLCFPRGEGAKIAKVAQREPLLLLFKGLQSGRSLWGGGRRVDNWSRRAVFRALSRREEGPLPLLHAFVPFSVKRYWQAGLLDEEGPFVVSRIPYTQERGFRPSE